MKALDIIDRARKSALTYWSADSKRDLDSHTNGYALGFMAALEFVQTEAETLLLDDFTKDGLVKLVQQICKLEV